MIRAICIVGLLVSTCYALDPNQIARDSERSGVCPLHHVRLIHGVAYDYSANPRTTIDLSNEGAALWKKYPNAIYPGFARKQSADWKKPVPVIYCPVCERLFDKEIAKQH